MKTISLALGLFTILTSASPDLPEIGAFKPGVGSTPDALKISEEASSHPNQNRSISFTRLYNGAPETWTWRLKITDMLFPNSKNDLGKSSANYSEGLHVANTQWQLQWPGDNDSLQTVLAERNETVEFFAMITHKPWNITQNYSKQDIGNCTAVLGAECAQSLQQAASKGQQTSTAGLKGCESSLDVAGNGTDSSMGFSLEPLSRPNDQTCQQSSRSAA